MKLNRYYLRLVFYLAVCFVLPVCSSGSIALPISGTFSGIVLNYNVGLAGDVVSRDFDDTSVPSFPESPIEEKEEKEETEEETQEGKDGSDDDARNFLLTQYRFSAGRLTAVFSNEAVAGITSTPLYILFHSWKHFTLSIF